jgi:hypothetical protein
MPTATLPSSFGRSIGPTSAVTFSSSQSVRRPAHTGIEEIHRAVAQFDAIDQDFRQRAGHLIRLRLRAGHVQKRRQHPQCAVTGAEHGQIAAFHLDACDTHPG